MEGLIPFNLTPQHWAGSYTQLREKGKGYLRFTLPVRTVVNFLLIENICLLSLLHSKLNAFHLVCLKKQSSVGVVQDLDR